MDEFNEAMDEVALKAMFSEVLYTEPTVPPRKEYVSFLAENTSGVSAEAKANLAAAVSIS